MKKPTLLILILLSLILSSCEKVEKQFQNDADILRLEHLQYWTGLVEEFHQKTGSYPFQTEVSSNSEIGLVKIITSQQRRYLSYGGDKYNPKFDNNANGRFKEFTINNFVSILEKGLGRKIDEKYDIQKVPTNHAIGYFYFVENDGYLIWVPCKSCGVTKISTLLMDGVTPTVNIVSEGKMKKKVPKSLTRKEMMEHPIFKKWINTPLKKEDYVKSIVKDNSHDSKNK